MFSKATEYALRAAIFIAQKSSEDNKLGIDEIARAINSPRSFTAKTLQLLSADNKIVHSTRGPNGGFYMSEKARKLPARAILEAMQEDDLLEKCVLGLKQCSEAKPCPMHSEYKSIKLQLKTLFETTTIQQLADELGKGDSKTKAGVTILYK
ncbi:Rrf2 family transcriptional regulator [Asinibacterium sp. OR53]|uniref:RrF2 family transcriptional regulator n=1 Tax=Asinibacterium sp. OR53 TaxID=925409 RepID=UPI0004280167|nr:Rrf2 family transcriptional regulator [Asinibacterium sp. OR53]